MIFLLLGSRMGVVGNRQAREESDTSASLKNFRRRDGQTLSSVVVGLMRMRLFFFSLSSSESIVVASCKHYF